MNKDVIYIEPEDDITDILANIKGAKNRIVALVPPKKAGVLRSAVNFKLIAKTAARLDKAIVLISSDESLVRLATAVKMPVAKTLQSKPQIPKDMPSSAKHDSLSDTIEAEKPKASADKDEEEKPAKKEAEKSTEKPTVKQDTQKAAEEEKDEIRPAFKTAKDTKGKVKEPEVLELDDEDKAERRSARSAKTVIPKSIPNFLKYRKFIIAGGVLVAAIVAFVLWGILAHKAEVEVTIRTSTENFVEDVRFTSNSSAAKVEDGVFAIEEKTVKKEAEVEFEATGDLDKGQKATGSIRLTIGKNTTASMNEVRSGVSILPGATFVYGQNKYKVTEGLSLSSDDLFDNGMPCKSDGRCTANKNITLGTVMVEAVENGDNYNIASAENGWSYQSEIWYADNLIFFSSEMTGGSSEKVKVVSQEDIDKAKQEAILPEQTEIINELTSQFDGSVLIIKESYKTSDPSLKSEPEIGGEVKEGQKAKLKIEKTYTVYAVNRKDINDFISAKSLSKSGVDDKVIYSTGVSGFDKKLTEKDDTSTDAQKDAVFFEKFKANDEGFTAKLKSTVKLAPDVTEESVYNKILGKKQSEARSFLKSTNGVSDVSINVSPFFKSSIPSNQEKVTVVIKTE